MATTTNTRSRRGSITGRQSLSMIDANENKQIKQQTPIKVLVFSGKCSTIFKSTLEECVDDCILEFQGENPIYIPKAGQSIQKSILNKQTGNYYLKESHSNLNQSARLSNRRRSSITQFNNPQIVGIRTSQTNNLTLTTAALTATSATRMRHQVAHPLVENITEETTTDSQTTIQDPTTTIEPDSDNPQVSQEETLSHPSNFDTLSQLFLPSHRKLPSAPVHSSYRSRQKNFRLSDLVMNGPEYYAHIFNFPRIPRYTTQTPSRQRSSTRQKQRIKTEDKYTELDRIKQDLFHRYLWTQKPQVSCRIRPMSTYTRSTTFVL